MKIAHFAIIPFFDVLFVIIVKDCSMQLLNEFPNFLAFERNFISSGGHVDAIWIINMVTQACHPLSAGLILLYRSVESVYPSSSVFA